MKFTIINILSIVVLGSCMASLTSCEISLSEEVYFPEHEVLVVHSFISPQDTGVLVMVAKSNSIMSE
ncbi:MAG: hypothetical protein OEY51_08635, partial [Cyclobacteriaceae bacterium]|nr:hypothetical protein [Cyclobacteriaceae bacterium]